MRVILASASPRRRELLSQLLSDFEVEISYVDEDALTVPDPWNTAEGLARAKTLAVAAKNPEALVIGGDTVVAVEVDNCFRQLAKPRDIKEAEQMLALLSGKAHLVITGVALAMGGECESFTETSRVTFRVLSDREISAYVATGEPMDKAGAYAIQGGASSFIDNLDGSLTNVIGLPLEPLHSRLAERIR